MKAKQADWYQRAWSMDIMNMSWVEDTEKQVEFISRTLGLSGRESILDLACGFGRHSLELARKGHRVVGVDLTKAYVEHASAAAGKEGLDAKFLCGDIRDICFRDEFDVALNLADGAIGYLETEEENLKIFDVISRALKPGGKHFMDLCNAEHAECCFPKRWWEPGERELSLAEFAWDPESRRMLCGGWQIPYGAPAQRPGELEADPIRLYSKAELQTILTKRNMEIVRTYSGYDGREDTPRELQLLVYSRKIRCNCQTGPKCGANGWSIGEKP